MIQNALKPKKNPIRRPKQKYFQKKSKKYIPKTRKRCFERKLIRRMNKK